MDPLLFELTEKLAELRAEQKRYTGRGSDGEDRIYAQGMSLVLSRIENLIAPYLAPPPSLG